jgi:hypothetical protein
MSNSVFVHIREINRADDTGTVVDQHINTAHIIGFYYDCDNNVTVVSMITGEDYTIKGTVHELKQKIQQAARSEYFFGMDLAKYGGESTPQLKIPISKSIDYQHDINSEANRKQIVEKVFSKDSAK